MGRLCKRLLPAVLAAALVLGWHAAPARPVFAPRDARRPLLVVMYHSLVTDDRAAGEYVCPISRVEQDFAALKARGYESVSLAQLVDFAQGRGLLPPKPVLITLDDGYRNNLTLLPPLLERYDMRAVIGVVGEYADIYTRSGEDGSPHSCMGWEDVRRAAQCPRLELAAHSYYLHHLSPRLGAGMKAGEAAPAWRALVEQDTRRLLEAMEARCGVTPLCYAYPYGSIAPGADGLMAELGFRVTLSCREAVSTVQAGDPQSLFSLGRWNRDGRWTTEAFLSRLGL